MVQEEVRAVPLLIGTLKRVRALYDSTETQAEIDLAVRTLEECGAMNLEDALTEYYEASYGTLGDDDDLTIPQHEVRGLILGAVTATSYIFEGDS